MKKRETGYGTWKIPNDESGIRIIKEALETGYRHIDTAERYGNEEAVGEAVRLSKIPREEIHITSKVWKDRITYDSVLWAAEDSLKRLGMEYMDMYLIHWPVPIGGKYDSIQTNRKLWRAMERLLEQKLVQKIGVANFMPRHLEPLLKEANTIPAVDQIELHPGCGQKEACEYCKKAGIQIEAWSPLGSGQVLKLPAIREIAEKYGVKEADICLQWLRQKEIVPIVRSANRERMKNNLMSGGFRLENSEMEQLDALPIMGDPNGIDPDTFTQW